MKDSIDSSCSIPQDIFRSDERVVVVVVVIIIPRWWWLSEIQNSMFGNVATAGHGNKIQQIFFHGSDDPIVISNENCRSIPKVLLLLSIIIVIIIIIIVMMIQIGPVGPLEPGDDVSGSA
jgi:hypothetical protein